MQQPVGERRPISTRNTQWAQALARILTRLGLRPNWISIASVGFAALAAACLVRSPHCPATGHTARLYLAAAACIQLRLLCNLLDGMVAVEGGRRTKSGEVFNEFPDRIADGLILIGAGYAIPDIPHGIELGWLVGVLAVLTAYTRVLGGSLGLRQSFAGPMAKQHRMAVMTGALLVGIVASASHRHQYVLMVALGTVAIGCVLTTLRRVIRVVRELEAREDA